MASQERADGGSASSQAQDLTEDRWAARPAVAALIRIVTVASPIALAIGATRAYAALVDWPVGVIPRLLYWVGAVIVSTVVLVGADRLGRRLLPLAAMYRLSLVFPDQAPSRYSVVLRRGTVHQLRRQLTANADGVPPGEAAAALLALVSELGRHDRLTRGHSERVRAYSDLIAEEMKLPAEDREKLHWAALLHDVGKLTVPPEILNKPGRPNEAEWAVLREHPANADDLLASLRSWLGPWALAATEHHERFDGTGYPNGLAGTDISLAGRIVAVADAYDVMTSARSYKKALRPEVARQELAKCAGTHFDPAVVRAFLRVSLGRVRAVTGPIAGLLPAIGVAQVPLTASTAILTAFTGLLGAVEAPAPAQPVAAASRVVENEPLGEEQPATTTIAVAERAEGLRPAPSAPNPTAAPSAVTGPTTPPTTVPPPASIPPTVPSPSTPATTVPTVTTVAPTVPATTIEVPVVTTTSIPAVTTTVPAIPPVAVADAGTVVLAQSTTIAVLANDLSGGSGFDGSTLRVVAPPRRGSAEVVGTMIRYTPGGIGLGVTEFTYEICNNDGLCDTAAVVVTILLA